MSSEAEDEVALPDARPSLLHLTPEAAGELLGGSGRAKLVWELLRDGHDPFGEDGEAQLPGPTRQALLQRFSPPAYTLCGEASVSECGTHKLLLSLPAGGDIELVLIPHRSGAFSTLCLSSQVSVAS